MDISITILAENVKVYYCEECKKFTDDAFHLYWPADNSKYIDAVEHRSKEMTLLEALNKLLLMKENK